MNGLTKMSARDLTAVLEKMGCVIDSKGHNQSRLYMKNEVNGKHFFIPLAGKKKIQTNTIQNILKHAEIGKNDFIKNI